MARQLTPKENEIFSELQRLASRRTVKDAYGKLPDDFMEQAAKVAGSQRSLVRNRTKLRQLGKLRYEAGGRGQAGTWWAKLSEEANESKDDKKVSLAEAHYERAYRALLEIPRLREQDGWAQLDIERKPTKPVAEAIGLSKFTAGKILRELATAGIYRVDRQGNNYSYWVKFPAYSLSADMDPLQSTLGVAEPTQYASPESPVNTAWMHLLQERASKLGDEFIPCLQSLLEVLTLVPDKFQNLEKVVAELQQDNEQLRREKSELGERVRELQAENDALHSTLEASTAGLNEIEQRMRGWLQSLPQL